jgi:hypothetical protein
MVIVSSRRRYSFRISVSDNEYSEQDAAQGLVENLPLNNERSWQVDGDTWTVCKCGEGPCKARLPSGGLYFEGMAYSTRAVL